MPHRSAAPPSECSLGLDAAPDLTTKGRDALTAECCGHSCVELLRPRNRASRFSLHSEYRARGSACLIDRTSGRPAATPSGHPSVSFPLSIHRVSVRAISVHRLRVMRLRKPEWKAHCFQCLRAPESKFGGQSVGSVFWCANLPLLSRVCDSASGGQTAMVSILVSNSLRHCPLAAQRLAPDVPAWPATKANLARERGRR